MKPWIRIGEGQTPDGTVLELCQRGDEMMIRAGGQALMGSRSSGSESALAQLAIEKLGARAGARVLIGGLGCGYTLRAGLDRLQADASVRVAELVPAVVTWNRGPLAGLAGRPLDDPRVTVVTADVANLVRSSSRAFDVILLDVDNGPIAFADHGNAWLYSHRGLCRVARALAPGGVLGVWSAGPDEAFSARLRASGFAAKCHEVRANPSGKGQRHAIWVATHLS
jgi:spermidine synthase